MEETKETDEPVAINTKVNEPVSSKSDTPQLPSDFTKHLLGEALALATVTVVAYLLAYVYEFSYCSALGIPTGCIEIGTMQLIKAISATVVVFFAFFGALAPFSNKIQSIAPIVALSLLAVPFLAPSVVSLPYTPLIVVAFMTLLFPWVWPAERRALLGQLMMVFIVVFILAGALGEYSAKTQSFYLSQRDMPEWVVLRRYGDVLVMGKVDGRKLTSEIRFEKYAEGGLIFKTVKTGPLVPQTH